VKRADEAGTDVSVEYAIISGAVRLIVLHSSALPARNDERDREMFILSVAEGDGRGI